MRGKDQAVKKSTERTRITPAYAGKRSKPATLTGQEKDHPRLCGEKYNADIGQVVTLGSPPPMRGKAACQTRSPAWRRITPAYAGKREIS